MGKLFGTDGVRGVAGKDLTCELALQIGRATAAELTSLDGHRPRILIGKDTRVSGTEPKIRVMVEGEDMEAIQSSAERIADMIRQRIPGVC